MEADTDNGTTVIEAPLAEFVETADGRLVFQHTDDTVTPDEQFESTADAEAFLEAATDATYNEEERTTLVETNIGGLDLYVDTSQFGVVPHGDDPLDAHAEDGSNGVWFGRDDFIEALEEHTGDGDGRGKQ